MRVLLVEDDPAVAGGVVDVLVGAGMAVDHVLTGAEGLAGAAGADIVLVDLGLPDMDGTDVVRGIRTTSAVPLIVISARSEELDRILALELGADDYLVKPFGMRELLARIRAVTRRSQTGEPESAIRELGPLAIDLRSRRVVLGGDELHLTPIEFDLLAYLSSEPGAVRRRAEILRAVWQTEWFGASKTLDAHVAALRRKLGDRSWIQAVHSVGFRFEVRT